jgi:uncharacterized protein YlaN (UPF0358 family)
MLFIKHLFFVIILELLIIPRMGSSGVKARTRTRTRNRKLTSSKRMKEQTGPSGFFYGSSHPQSMSVITTQGMLKYNQRHAFILRCISKHVKANLLSDDILKCISTFISEEGPLGKVHAELMHLLQPSEKERSKLDLLNPKLAMLILKKLMKDEKWKTEIFDNRQFWQFLHEYISRWTFIMEMRFDNDNEALEMLKRDIRSINLVIQKQLDAFKRPAIPSSKKLADVVEEYLNKSLNDFEKAVDRRRISLKPYPILSALFDFLLILVAYGVTGLIALLILTPFILSKSP